MKNVTVPNIASRGVRADIDDAERMRGTDPLHVGAVFPPNNAYFGPFEKNAEQRNSGFHFR